MLLRSGAFCKANNPPAVWSGTGRLEWLSLHRWGVAGVWFESAAETQSIHDATRISLRVGHSRQLHPSGRRGTLPVEHRLAVLEISQNHEAGGRGRQVFEGMST